ncbi:MAG: UDP-N-acetylglucosamine/UDP-N-acetylgalactosamine diphosphorylase, partial [Mariniblastus sp.]
CEVGPADGFCAVKNASPAKSETPEHVKAAISDLHQRWLTQAGVTVADGIQVEISPLFAPDAQSLVGKLESGTTITETTYFQ